MHIPAGPAYSFLTPDNKLQMVAVSDIPKVDSLHSPGLTIGGNQDFQAVHWEDDGLIHFKNTGVDLWDSRGAGPPVEFYSLYALGMPQGHTYGGLPNRSKISWAPSQIAYLRDRGREDVIANSYKLIRRSDNKRGPGDQFHKIFPGEWIPVAHDAAKLFAEPSQERRSLMLNWLRSHRLDTELLDSPRVRHLIGLWGDKGSKADAQGADRDAGWLKRYVHLRNGGLPSTDYFRLLHIRGDLTNFNGANYGQNACMLLAYLLDPTPENYIHGLSSAIAYASAGIYRGQGQFNYLHKWEEGAVQLGDESKPSWAKQHDFEGLALWAILSGNRFLWETVRQQMTSINNQVFHTFPKTWDGRWGARIPANWLAAQRFLRNYARTFWGREAAEALVVESRRESREAAKGYLDLVDSEKGYWVNRGDRNSTSPWMNAQLAYEVFEAVKGDSELEERVLDVMDQIYDASDYDYDSGSYCHYLFSYRFEGHEKYSYPGYERLGLMMPMFRALRDERPETYKDVIEVDYDRFTEWVGTNITHSSIPTPLSEIGIEFPDKGGGFVKGTKMALWGLWK